MRGMPMRTGSPVTCSASRSMPRSLAVPPVRTSPADTMSSCTERLTSVITISRISSQRACRISHSRRRGTVFCRSDPKQSSSTDSSASTMLGIAQP